MTRRTGFSREVQVLNDRTLLSEREIRRIRARLDQIMTSDELRAGTSFQGVLPVDQGGTGIVGSPLGVTMWVNDTGGVVSRGTVAVENGDRTFNVTTNVADPLTIGIVDDDAVADQANCRVRHVGYQEVVIVEGAVAAGNYLQSSATSGASEDAGATAGAGFIGIALTAFAGPGAGTVSALVFPAMGGGGGGGAALTVQEEDGAPLDAAVTIVRVPNGTLTDNGAGDVSLGYEASGAVAAHTGDAADAHDASAISILDTANDFLATDVEGALAELQDQYETDAAALTAHLADTSDAHDASAISILDTANDFTATDVEGALAEIQTDIEALQAKKRVVCITLADTSVYGLTNIGYLNGWPVTFTIGTIYVNSAVNNPTNLHEYDVVFDGATVYSLDLAVGTKTISQAVSQSISNTTRVDVDRTDAFTTEHGGGVVQVFLVEA